MSNDFHRDLPNPELHDLKDFSIADGSTVPSKSAAGVFEWIPKEDIGGSKGDPGQFENQLFVNTVPETGQFGSIKDAVDSITDASLSKPYVVYVGPGQFVEDTITMKPFVSIQGLDRNTSNIITDSPSKDLIIGTNDSSISNVTLSGSTDTGKALIKITSTMAGGVFTVAESLFGNGDQFVLLDSVNFAQITVHDCFSTSMSNPTNAFHATGAGISVVAIISFNGVFGPGVSWTNVFLADRPTSQFILFGVGLMSAGGVATNGIHLINGAKVSTQGVAFLSGVLRAVYVENVGVAPTIQIASLTVLGATDDIFIEHPGATGFINGAFTKSKVIVDDAASISITHSDPSGAGVGYAVIGSILQGDINSVTANISKLLRQGTVLGQIKGGQITDIGGLNINISPGEGFVEDVLGVVREVDWPTTNLVVPADADRLITIDADGLVQLEVTIPSPTQRIVLGGVVSDATTIDFIDNVPRTMRHHGSLVESYMRLAIGPIYASGSIVVENGVTDRALDISSGEYFFGTIDVKPTGGSAVSIRAYHDDGSGGFTRVVQSVVDNVNYDNTGLTALTAGFYARHSLYVNVNAGVDDYLLVYSQQEYSTLVLAEAASIPTPPPFFQGGVTLIASIIVQQGLSNIVSIFDERPRIGFKASGVSAASDHGNLTGLNDDDHPQYLLINGTRAMVGNLNMGGQAVTNVGNVDGVDVSGHASRHLPSGDDPIATATPLTVGTANSEGTAESLAKSDHVHNHGNQSDGTLHAAVIASGTSGFMTGGDKSKLDGIEVAATADQTDAEIKTAYENNANTNEFSDAEQTKLLGIETAATADQTDAEIKTAYENNANTNEFSDAEQTKLLGIEAGAQVNVYASVAPVNVTKAAAVVGVASVSARQDHKHDISTATAGTVGTVNSEGSATTLARSDHGHNHGNQTVGTHHAAVISGSTSGFMTGADKLKLDRLNIGHLSYSNSALQVISAITPINFQTDRESFANGLFTKVNATDFRADFAGQVEVSYKCKVEINNNDRGSEFRIQRNAVDLVWTESIANGKALLPDRANTGSGTFVLNCAVNDVFRLRANVPSGDNLNVNIDAAYMSVKVYRIT